MSLLCIRPFAFALLLVGLAACNNNTSNVYETKTAHPTLADFQSHISNPFLKDRVDVTSAYVGQASGLMRVQCNIVNRTAAPAFYMYKFTWFDAQGLKLSTNSDFWTRRELNGGGQEEITAISPTGAAVDWRLELRPWDR